MLSHKIDNLNNFKEGNLIIDNKYIYITFTRKDFGLYSMEYRVGTIQPPGSVCCYLVSSKINIGIADNVCSDFCQKRINIQYTMYIVGKYQS